MTNSNLPYKYALITGSRYYPILEISILLLVIFLFIFLVFPLAGDQPFQRQLMISSANVCIIMIIGLSQWIKGTGWSELGLTWKKLSLKTAGKTFLISLLVMALGMGGYLLGSALMINFTGFPEAADFSSYNYLKENTWMFVLALTGVYIGSSFGEEVIYRAFIITRIQTLGNKTRLSSIWAIIISTVIFGGIHYDWGPMGIAQTAGMGLVMGICYLKLNKKLWILILAHAYMDTILLVQLFLA